MARRRHNPLMTLKEVAPTLLMLGAAWLLYSYFKNLGKDSVRAGGELWNLITSSPVSNVNSVQLPTGEVITVDAIVANGGIDSSGNFEWYSVPYQISGSDPVSGLYVAKRIVT